MPEQRVIISHPDGRSYSVTQAGFAELYEPQGFEIVGPETDESFDVTGIPAPKAERKAPRAKGTSRPKPKPAKAIASPTPAEES